MTEEQRETLLKAIYQSGVFITSGDKESPNVMAAHWGTLGNMWNKPVFIIPIRQSKYTHELLDKMPYFGVSVPVKDMRNEIIMCNQLSGFNVNKFEELHLHPKRSKHIPPYLIAECGMYLECKVICTANMEPDILDEEIIKEFYSNQDYHALYFGEILECYYADEE